MRRLGLAFVLSLSVAVSCGGSTGQRAPAAGGSSGSAQGGTGGSAQGGTGGSAQGGTGGGTGGTTAGGSGGATSGGSAGTAGSDAGSDSAAPCVEGGDMDGSVEDKIVAACVVAVVKVVRIDEECSGAGGSHVTLDVLELGRGSGVTKVSYGGHAYYPPPGGPDTIGDIFVAGIDGLGQLTPQPDNAGWCLVGLPAVDGVAHTLLAAASQSDASAKMKQLLTP